MPHKCVVVIDDDLAFVVAPAASTNFTCQHTVHAGKQLELSGAKHQQHGLKKRATFSELTILVLDYLRFIVIVIK